MPHAPAHDSDFRTYATTRQRALKNIRQLTCYLNQLAKVVKAMPARKDEAGYLDLDNIEQIDGDVADAVETICDWESLDDELLRFAIK